MQDEVFKMYNLQQIMLLLDWINQGKWVKLGNRWYSLMGINAGITYDIFGLLRIFEKDCKI
jgi:hypothetical protein